MRSLRKSKNLKIAIVAPIWVRVPPVSYGGIELIVSLLADGLVDRGHDVTLFATQNATVKARIASVFKEPQVDKIGKALPEVYHCGVAYKRIEEGGFDIVHDHTQSAPVLGALAKTPVLATIHGELNDFTISFYRAFRNDVFYNAICEHQRRAVPDLRFVDTVYNAIDYGAVEVETEKRGYLLSIGRIGPEKGVHNAIEVAKKLGRPLVLAGKVDPGKDKDYFKNEIAPHIDDRLIRFVGEVSGREKRRLMGEASCLLFPVEWAEPFGLVMLEAMAAGTPVVAYDRGAVKEVVEPGISGYIVRDREEMADAVGAIDRIDPRGCRTYVETKFSTSAMIDGYLKNYRQIIHEDRIGRYLATG